MKCWAGGSTKWNQDCQEKHQWPQICRWYYPYRRKWRGTKEPLDESERGKWKTFLKINIQKTKIMASGPNTSWQIDRETMETGRLYFLGLQNHCRRWLQPWNEKTLAPWKKSYDQPRQNIKKQKRYFGDKSGVAQSCPTLCNPMDCSLPGSSVHRIFQAIVLEWVSISFSRGSSRPRDWTQVSSIVDRRFTMWATRINVAEKGQY